MLTNICLFLAVVCWLLGFMKVTFTANGKPQSPDWLCGGLFFAGLGLWIVPLF